MNSKIKSQVRTITPEEALELLKFNTRNRPLKKNVVIDYARQMKDGLWKTNGEPIIISDGNVILDGQHRLAACVKSNTPITSVITTGVDASVFDTIDTGIVRTGGDILSIDGVKNANHISAGITKYFIISRSRTSVTMDGTQALRKIKMSKQEILSFYKKNASVCNEVTIFADACRKKIGLMKTSQISGIMLHLILDKHHPVDRVKDFFRQLFFDENVTNNTITILREKLLKDQIGQYKLTPSARDAYIKKTWNSFVKGKELKNLIYSAKDRETLDFI